MSYILRDYQEKAVNTIMDYINGPSKKPVAASLPTGSGKSVVLGETVRRSNNKAIVLQPNKELLEQNVAKAMALGVDGIGIYSASAGSKEIGESLTYSTLGSIKDKAKDFKAQGYNMVLIDECHHGTNWGKGGSMFKSFIKEFAPKKVIGVSATCYRLHSNMTGSKLKMLNRMHPSYFKDIIHVTQVKELLDGGYLTPTSYETHEFDESGLLLNSSGAEFNEDSVRSAIKTQGINNNIYLRVMELQKKGYTSILVFVDSVANAKKFADVVPNSACLSAETPTKERTRIVQEFKAGIINTVFNVKILTTGFDYEALQVVIMGYPTMSMGLYTQIGGRLSRIFPGKAEGLFIDYCNNVKRFGKIEEQEVIDFEDHGWGVFTGDERLVTGTYISGGYTVTKDDLRNKAKGLVVETKTLWFGKYSGKSLEEVLKIDPGYLTYMLNNFDFKGDKMQALKRSIQATMLIDTIRGEQPETSVEEPSSPVIPF